MASGYFLNTYFALKCLNNLPIKKVMNIFFLSISIILSHVFLKNLK